MRDEWDAIVVGGGPAGATVALMLAQLGWRCALVERRPRNRAKTCGHCLGSAAIPLLRSIGLLDEVKAIACASIDALRIHLPNGRRLRLLMTSERGERGLVVERSRLDQLLIDCAADCGTSVFQPATARPVELHSTTATIDLLQGEERLRMRTRLLIAADGLRSAIARKAMGVHSHIGRKYGFSFNVSAEWMRLERGAIDMFVTNRGYLGAVCQGDKRVHIAALVQGGRSPLQFCDDLAAQHRELGNLRIDALDRNHMADYTAIGPMPCTARRVASGPVALVGDAAGYVEPFTGEGMHWAMLSATVLAEVASRSRPGTWSASQAEFYQRRWADCIGRRQRLCEAVGWALERPGLMTTLAGFIPGSDAVLRRIAAQVSAA